MSFLPSEPPIPLPDLLRLGPTVRSPDGSIDGPVGFAVDLAGTVRDRQGALTFEQRVVGGPPGSFESVPAIVRLLLLFAIPQYLARHEDRGWMTIRDDLWRVPPEAPIHPLEPDLAVGRGALPPSPPEAFADLFQNGHGGGGPGGWPRPPWPPPPPHPQPPPPPFQAARYVFTVVSMTITNTRSRHEDSDKASVSLAIGNNPPQTITRNLGDLNNGTFALGMSIGPFEVADPNIGIAANYLIVNAGGSDWRTVDAILTKAGGALAAAGAKAATEAAGAAVGASIGTGVVPIIGTVLGAVAGWLVSEALNIFFANCDGPVAAEQPAFKGIDLWNRTHTPTNSLTHETYHPGIDSPTGCGSNSQYYVTWSVTRVG